MEELSVITLLVLCCCERNMAKSLETGDTVIDLSHFGARLFGSPVENDKRTWNELDGNAEEQGPYLEGDLLIPSHEKNGMKSESLRWKNGEVPFEIHGSFSEFVLKLKPTFLFFSFYELLAKNQTMINF